MGKTNQDYIQEFFIYKKRLNLHENAPVQKMWSIKKWKDF